MGISYYEIPSSSIPPVPETLFVNTSLGSLTSQGAANVSGSGSATQTNFPRTLAMCIGGDQGYSGSNYQGQVTGKVMSASGFFQESSYSNPVPWMGRYDVVVIGGNWEGWAGGGDDRGVLVDCIRQITHVSGFNSSAVFQYSMFQNRQTNAGGQPYNSWFPTVDSKKWGLYNAANQTGSLVATGNGYTTNFAVAWPGSVNGVAADQQISPGRTTAQYDGNPEDLMQSNAAYIIELMFARHSALVTTVDGSIGASAYTDSRYYPNLVTGSNPDAMKAPNLTGTYQDNLWSAPGEAGYYDLANNYSAYNYSSPAMPWLLRGSQHFGTRWAAIMSRCYPSRTYVWMGNIAELPQTFLSNRSTWSTITNGVTTLGGGFLEGMVGPSYGVDSGSGTVAAIQSYQACIDWTVAPKYTGVNGVMSSSTDYQTGRYTLGIALMADGYCSLTTGLTYAVNVNIWIDEFGGNPGTNIGKGWLGQPNGTRPNGAAISGCWVRDFSHGTVILNPKGNGTVTITPGQLNSYLGTSYTFKFFKGVQVPSINTGLTMGSVTIAAGDAVLLQH